MIRATFLILAIAIGGAPATARAANVSDELLRCHALEGGRARLDCYDALAALVAQGTVVTLPVEDLNEVGRQRDFGLERPADEPDRIAASIASLYRLPRGQFEVTLDNGQVWREIEATGRSRYQPGDAITIRRTRLGNYRLRVEATGYSNTVKRVR